jgi:hypothetical protein
MDLISRKTLMKSIREVSASPLNEWDTMGVLKIVNEQPSVTDTDVGGKWIPCSERLPECDTDVLICSGEFVHEARFKDEHFSNAYGMWYKAVTHWMPLPEPYKGGITWI